MRARRPGRLHAERAESGPGMERWLLTYADMITLLLALFVVLFALSTLSARKFLEFRLGLTQSFNPAPLSTNGGSGLLDQNSIVAHPLDVHNLVPALGASAPRAASPAQIERIAGQIRRALDRSRLAGDAAVTVTREGVVVQVLADRVFFATDSATLGWTGERIVDTIAGAVRRDPNRVVVQGYTDDQPIKGGPYSSNWELSAVRAANVVDRLNVVDGIESARLSASGYGDTRPAVANTSAGAKAKNRRIDVVVLKS